MTMLCTQRYSSLLLLVAFGLLTGCVTSSRSGYLQRDVAAFINADSVDVADYQARYEDYDGVYTHWERTAEHIAGSVLGGGMAWVYLQDSRIRYVVLNPEAEWLTTFRTQIARGGEVEGIAVRVTAPDGSSRLFTKSDLVEESGSSGTVYKLAYPNVEVGTVVEENVRVRYEAGPNFSPPLEYDIPLQFGIPAERVSYRFAYPSWWALQLKKVAPRQVPLYDTEYDEENKKTILRYKAHDVPAVRDEIYSPYFKEMAHYLQFQITDLKIGSAGYKATASWEDLADGFKKYAFRRGGLFSNPVKRALGELDLEGKSSEEKLDEIVTYVQTTIELGASSKDDFNTVLKERRGNIYMITGLTQAILVEAGVEADFLMIHTAADGYFDESYINSSQLYMPAVTARINGSPRVVFPWAKLLPITHVPEYFQGQTAMRIDADGFGGFMEIPSGNAADNATEENYVVTLQPDGQVVVEEEKVFRGSSAYGIRVALDDLEEEEREEEIRDLLTYTDGEVQDVVYTIENEASYKEPLIIRLSYTIDNLLTVTPEEILFQTGGLFSPASRTTIKVDTGERQSPIRIYFDEVIHKRIELRYPEAWSLTSAFEDLAVENLFGKLEGSYSAEPGRFVAEQTLMLHQSEAPKHSLATLLDLTGSSAKLQLPTMVFEVVES